MEMFNKFALEEKKQKVSKEDIHNDIEEDISDEAGLDILVDTTGSFYPDFDSLTSDD